MRINIAKISFPVLSAIVPRPRLFHLLDRARKKPVVWISAPAGSGKTTLITSYLKARKLPCLWYHVDEGDGDAASFFYYLGLAVKKAAPRIRRPMPLLTPEHLTGLTTFSRNYFRELFNRFRDPGVVVLDNYQDVPVESLFNEVVASGLSEIPDGRLVVVISRHDPPAVFSRLQVSGQLALVGWRNVRLTLEESKAISNLRLGKNSVSAVDLRKWHEKTMGWVAGLVLWLEQRREGSVSGKTLDHGTQRVLFDYFAGELFDKSNKVIRNFLLKTAYLPRIVVSAARHLTGNSRAGEVLEDLTHKNFFTIRRGDFPPAYEYHPLFREFLINYGTSVWGARELAAIQDAAAKQLEGVGQVEDAAAFFCKSGSWVDAARLILNHAPALMTQGRGKTLAAWIERLPVKMVRQTPWLLYWQGNCLLPFNPARSREHFERAFRLFNARKQPTGIYLAWCGVVDAIHFEFDGFKGLDRWIKCLDKLINEYPTFPSREIEAHVSMSIFKALVFRNPMHPDIHTWAERVLRLIRSATDINLRIEAGFYLIHYGIFWDFPNASVLIHTLQELSRSEEKITPWNQVLIKVIEMIYYWFSCLPEKCLEVVSRGLDVAQTSGVHVMDYQFLGFGVMASLTTGDSAGARRFLQKMTPVLDQGHRFDKTFYHYLVSWEALVRGDIPLAFRHSETGLEEAGEMGGPAFEGLYELLMAQILHEKGQDHKAAGYLSRSRRTAGRLNIPPLEWTCLLAEAQFFLERGNERSGLASLRRAMTLGRERGLFNFFGWRPAVMTGLCIRALEAGIEIEYVRELIRKRKLVSSSPPVEIESWPWSLRIYTMGRFSLVRDGKQVRFTGKAQKKPLEMLKALIALGSRGIPEERLGLILWPDALGDAAYQATRTTLHRLRRLIGEEVIVKKGGSISLDARYCWVDCWALERLLRRLEHQGWEETSTQRLFDQVVNMYQGPFLAGDSVYWVLTPRERLRSKFQRCLHKLEKALCESGRCEEAIIALQKVVEVDPLAEAFYRDLMTCHAALGRRTEALAVYLRCRRVITSVLGVEPTPETHALYRAIYENRAPTTPFTCRKRATT